MRLCFVAPRAWPVLSRDARIADVGGAEVQQSILARLFAAAGHAVSMVTLDYGQPEPSRVDGVTVHKAFAPGAGLPALRFLHPKITGMWRALARADADVYYVRAASMWLAVVARFCRRYGRRSVYAGASDRDFVPGVGGQLPTARDRWLFRRGLADADAIVAQNEFQRASCRETHGRDAVVIPSCYLPPADRAAAAQRDLVLWVGMLEENKRPGMFLDLARRLPHRRFVLVGGPRHGSAALFERVRAEAAGVPNLEMTGFLPLAEAERWFDRARVLVNTSTYEGMPNTFLQAWARGVPTVATVDVGVPAHQVAADLDGLAERTEQAYLDPAPGERCREYFERHHAAGTVLERYTSVFQAL